MSCFEEFTYAMYADGELSPEESRNVEDHLQGCRDCEGVVEALRLESRLITEVLEETAPAAVRRPRVPPAPWRVARASAAAILVAAILRGGLSAASGVEVPDAVSWLNPFSVNGLVKILFDGVFLAVTEGGAMILASITQVLGVLIAAVVVAGLLQATRRQARTAVTAGVLAALILLPGIASAQEQGPDMSETIIVPAGETIDGTTFKGGKVIALDGDVDGDLFVGAERAIIRGTVKGNLFAVGQSIEINGTVEGSVHACGQDVTIAGTVEGNVYGAGRTVRMEEGARVARDLFFAGETCSVAGTVARDVHAYGKTVEIRAGIHRNLTAGGEAVTLLDPASVGGDLSVEVPAKEHCRIADGVVVAGARDIKIHTPGTKQCPNRYASPGFYVMQLVWMGGAFLVGCIAMLILPGFYGHRFSSAGSALLTGLVGFGALIMIPVSAVILCCTVLGLPMGIIAFVLYFIGLYIAKIAVAAQIGQGILGSANGNRARFVIRLLLGLIIVYVAINLPYVGGPISFLVLLLGLGSLVIPMFRRPLPEPEMI